MPPRRKISQVDVNKDGHVTSIKTEPTMESRVDDGKGSVSYTLSITKNLGGYESLKIQAGITIPHGASDEMLADLDSLIVVAKEKVVNRLMADVDDLTNAIK